MCSYFIINKYNFKSKFYLKISNNLNKNDITVF